MATKKVTGWVGWVFFAGFIMILLGVFQALFGLVAIMNNGWFVIAGQGLLVWDLTTWGWIHLILGLVIFLAGFAVLGGKMWGRVVGVILAVLSALSALLSLNIHPVWSIILMVVDVLVIYALTVHGREVDNLS